MLIWCISSKNQDIVVILNAVWHAFIDHFMGNTHGSLKIMQRLCLSSSKKLIIGALKCSLLGAYWILKEIKVFSPALTQFLRSYQKDQFAKALLQRSKKSQNAYKIRIYPGILKEKNSLYFSEVFRQYGSQCHSKQAYSLDSLQHSHPTLVLHTAAWIEKVVRDRNSRKLVSAELVYSV